MTEATERIEEARPRRFRRYPEYKDSGVEWLGDIPAHWSALPIKRVCRLRYGESLAGDDRANGEVVVFGSNGPVGTHDSANAGAPCLIVGRKGSFGKVNYSADAVFAIDTTFVIDARYTQADLRWLYYTLQCARLDTISKDSAIPGLDREDAYARVIDLGPFHEQRAIAAFLDRETARIDGLVARKERLIELLQEKRAALITRAVTRGLDPNAPMKDSGIEWLGEIPAHWRVGKLKHACKRVFVGIAEAATFAYVDQGVPMLRSTDVRANRVRTDDIRRIDIAFADRLSSKQLRTDDIVTVRTGNAGVSAVVPPAYDRGQCFTLVVSRPTITNDSRYFCYWLNARTGRNQFKVEGMGTAQVNISVPIVQNALVYIPPLEEQRAIATFLDRETAKIDALISKIRQAIHHLKEFRTALISAAVTGKIDVREDA